MTTLVEQLSTLCRAACATKRCRAEVVHQAKRLIVDTVGCALGGYWSEPARIARDLAATVRSSEPVTVIGSGERTSVDLATFANGVMIRFLDFNDGYTSTGESGHPSDSIAAVLSTAELRRRSGRDAIAATVLAYEVFCRVCDAVDLKPLGFDHVTVGGMASTAAAARLLGPRTSARSRRLSTSASRPTSRSTRRASATSRCGKAARTPTRAATPCSPRCSPRAA